jgi:hypothetical protein
MNTELFSELLYAEESNVLDFKRDQYRFAKASDHEKSELLKDILGFANAWRRSEAYILIGVEEIRGARGNVVGIPAADQLDDHSVQQFVNSLTNQPVRFHYEAFGFEGKHLGIIRFDAQPRPVFLKRDYGKLKQDAVYVRRGTSTDPTKPATADEIAQMRLGSIPPAAELVVEFADVERDMSLGDRLSLNAELCEMPPRDSIPDYPRPNTQHPLGIDLSFLRYDTYNQPNPDYYRQLAAYEFVRRLARPVRLLVRNVSPVAAKNTRVELAIPAKAGVTIVEPSEIPDPPSTKYEIFNDAGMKGFRPALRRDPGEVTIDKNRERIRIEIDCRDLQPGRSIKSDEFLIVMKQSGELSVAGRVFADNLPDPRDFLLTLSATVTQTKVTVRDLLTQPPPEPIDD